jgi:hypothetical protein
MADERPEWNVELDPDDSPYRNGFGNPKPLPGSKKRTTSERKRRPAASDPADPVSD